MVSPNTKAIEDGAPTVTLAGEQWPIPMLAIKQNRIVCPLILKVAPSVQMKDGVSLEGLAKTITPELFENLASLTFVALTRAHKDMTMAAFDEMEITIFELMGAFPVIAAATGIVRMAKPGEVPLEPAQKEEAEAAMPATSQTGTQ
jgi:hypothetical protein